MLRWGQSVTTYRLWGKKSQARVISCSGDQSAVKKYVEGLTRRLWQQATGMTCRQVHGFWPLSKFAEFHTYRIRRTPMWSLLPEPHEWNTLNETDVHVFDCAERFVSSRKKSPNEVIGYLGSLLDKSTPKSTSRLPSRYRDGLVFVDRKVLERLQAELLQHA